MTEADNEEDGSEEKASKEDKAGRKKAVDKTQNSKGFRTSKIVDKSIPGKDDDKDYKKDPEIEGADMKSKEGGWTRLF